MDKKLTFKQKLVYRDKTLQKAISRILADFYISIGKEDDKQWKERFNKNLKKYTAKMYKVIKFMEVVV